MKLRLTHTASDSVWIWLDVRIAYSTLHWMIIWKRVSPVATYGCESWTLRKNEEKTSWRLWDDRTEKNSASFMDSRRQQMSGFLTRLDYSSIVYVDLYGASTQTRSDNGSHSVTCKQHHICLYSPVADHHRPLAGTHCAYPRRDGQVELTWVVG